MELLLIFVLAMIFIGPGKMPELAASLGKMLREFRAASAELTDALNAEIAEAERRKTAVAAGENGNGHSIADAAQAEVVAQGAIDAPAADGFASSEIINYNYEPPAAPATTIDDVLAAIAQQEAEEVSKREAEEAARRAAIALERAIRNGAGPLPESLLLPSTDSPLVVVNPTEQQAPEPAVTETAQPAVTLGIAIEAVGPEVVPDTASVAEPGEVEALSPASNGEAPYPASNGEAPYPTSNGEVPSPTSNGEVHDVAHALEPEASDGRPAEAEGESLEATRAGQAEVR